MEAEFSEQAAELGRETKLTTILAEEAMALLSNGDAAGHNKNLGQTAGNHFGGFDIVMLAQFSMAQAYSSVSKAIGATILTSPKSAVLKMKNLLRPETTFRRIAVLAYGIFFLYNELSAVNPSNRFSFVYC